MLDVINDYRSMAMTDTTPSPPADEPFNLETWPLEKGAPFEHDWGGDGSDPLRPVRAHVLAALQPAQGPYPAPLDELVRLGEAEDTDERRDELPITQEHVADLVRMARDRAFFTADPDTPAAWAAHHALAALIKLDASAVVPDLMPLFDLDDDWLPNSLADLFAAIGTPALPALQEYLNDQSRWTWGHAFVCDVLRRIAAEHEEVRATVVATLSAVLEQAERYHEQSVTGAMSNLVELQAVEALPLIRRAFEIGKIDESMLGPWGTVLEQLGIEPDPDDPLIVTSQQRYDEQHAQLSYGLGEHTSARPQAAPQRSTSRRKQDQARKVKQKRKAASAARKANKKKKRK
jgi:hypothetical protein